MISKPRYQRGDRIANRYLVHQALIGDMGQGVYSQNPRQAASHSPRLDCYRSENNLFSSVGVIVGHEA